MICALKADGSPARIDKAFTWENPMSAHGLMHMVISNAHAGDPYKIDTLFMYMANMSWNSSMNTTGVHADADRHATRTANTSSRTSSIPTPTAPKWWPMPI